MFKFSKTLICNTKNNKIIHNIATFNKYLSSTVEVRKVQNTQSDSNETNEYSTSTKANVPVKKLTSSSSSNMVAAAFASLKVNESSSTIEIPTPQTDKRIAAATTVNELLSLSNGSGVSRRHALQVVSILAEWSASHKVEMSDFEKDPRFVKLCKILTRTSRTVKKDQIDTKNEDLNMILSVTADDEAAKLIGTITISQMVKVMSALASKKRRSLSLLRSISYNITKSAQQLDLKQSADVFYSMAMLNFPDENLLSKVSSDVLANLNNSIKGSAVIGSMLTSLGLMRYKNTEILEALSMWMLNCNEISRPQDLCSLILTLAMLNYEPSNASKLYEVILPQLLKPTEANNSQAWLDLVWSLVILNRATSHQIASVLNPDFTKQFANCPSISPKLKLLNIDGAVKYLISNYTGPRLDTSIVSNVKLNRTRDKEEFVKSVVGSLKNLVKPEHLRCNVDSRMGFFIDAECIMDKKCSPIAFDDTSAEPGATRIAVVAYDFHDLCLGKTDPTGINSLAAKLLKSQGYAVLPVPYNMFKPTDKLIVRVRYLESKLKSLVMK